jgi:hypothetical protein
MFYFRINKLKILDNRERGDVLRVFRKDRAEVKLCSFITTEETRLPELDELLATNDPRRQKDLLAAAVAHVVGSRVLTAIQNVTDNHEMTFGDTGYVLYQSERIPDDFSWLLLAIESDRDEREIGQEMKSIVHGREFDDFLADTLTLVATAANPSFAAAIGIGKFVARTLGERIRKNKDDMVGLLYTSLNRREHYPHCERKRDQVPDLTNNMFVDYSIFGFEPHAQASPMRRLPPVTNGIRPRRAASRRTA